MPEAETWRMPVPMRLIDVAEDARRLYGTEAAAAIFPNLPAHDWRFELALPGGATVTLAGNATAQQVVAYLRREGVALSAENGADHAQ